MSNNPSLKHFLENESIFEKKKPKKQMKKKKTCKNLYGDNIPCLVNNYLGGRGGIYHGGKGVYDGSWGSHGGGMSSHGGGMSSHGGGVGGGGDGGGGGGVGGGGGGESVNSLANDDLLVELLAGIGTGSFSANMSIGPAMSKTSNNPEAGMTTYPSEDPNDWEWSEEEEPSIEVPHTDIEDNHGDEPQDPDRAGIIRVVKSAHLVYKRQTENGSFEELWIYNIHDKSHDELDIRRDILAGTDIPPKKTRSPDGQQQYSIVTMGNGQMIKISGLNN